jgi:hypothetical protein
LTFLARFDDNARVLVVSHKKPSEPTRGIGWNLP